MADDYKGLAVFVAVVDAGSFSAAARRLKLSTSVVSHHISKLEERLGVSLLYRSTRSLSLTSEGEKILPSARNMVASAARALDSVSQPEGYLSGTLRMTMPAFGINTQVHARVWEFARKNPLVEVSLRSSDRPADLVREGLDLGIRLGVLADSALKSRRIGSFQRVLVASPDYLKGRSIGEDPAALSDCDFVGLAMIQGPIVLQRAGENVSIEPSNTRIEVDSVAAAKAAILAGLGLQRLPLSEVQHELDTGALVEVLPSWRPPELGVYAVWPDSGAPKNLTRRMVDVLSGDAAP